MLYLASLTFKFDGKIQCFTNKSQNSSAPSNQPYKKLLRFIYIKKKRPGVNLPKQTKDLYAENYKPLMKEIKDDTNGYHHVLGLEESVL